MNSEILEISQADFRGNVMSVLSTQHNAWHVVGLCKGFRRDGREEGRRGQWREEERLSHFLFVFEEISKSNTS